eukprot:9092787-Alexandrium_andersonii.AAC.1
MSASLVGSEMCIRDRVRSVRMRPAGSGDDAAARMVGGSIEGHEHLDRTREFQEEAFELSEAASR